MAITSAAFDDGSNGASKATFTPSRNPNIGVQYGTDYTGVLVNQAVGGEVYTVERYGKRRTWSMTYTFLNATDQAILQVLIDYADGEKTFFYFAEDNFANGVDAVDGLTSGSSHTDGTYTNVELTGGSGTGVKATVVISSNAVNSVSITTSGSGYVENEELGIPISVVGGSGSPHCDVNGVTAGANSVKVRFNQDVFSFEEVAQGATSITLSIIEQL
jgi:hypothetical protein